MSATGLLHPPGDALGSRRRWSVGRGKRVRVRMRRR